MGIKIKDLTKDFGKYRALDNLSLDIATGELTALLGPSGCGKTTLLRIIAGLETPTSGTIELEGADTSKMAIQKRGVGFVFQHYALFRRMSVFDNVAFGLNVLPRHQRPSKDAIKDRVKELLTMVQMDWAMDRFPHQLSGGQRQRIALARALAVNPKVLLLDEPFSALDAKVRLELRRWLRRLHDEIHLTSVFVTHDQDEALELADKVVIINKGKIEQEGSPSDVYDHPGNPFVYQFLGNVNVFHGRLQNQSNLGEPEVSFVRPHEIGISTQPKNPEDWSAEIVDVRMVGQFVGVDLVSPSYEGIIEAQLNRDEWKALAMTRGQRVYVQWKSIKVFYPGAYQI